MSSRLFTALLTACLICSGCSTAPEIKGASRKPEVIIQGRSPEQIRNASLTLFKERGFTLKDTDALSLVFEKRGKASGSYAFGRNYNVAPNLRVHLNIVEEGGGTYRLIATPFVFGNVSQESVGASNQMKLYLEEIKVKLLAPPVEETSSK